MISTRFSKASASTSIASSVSVCVSVAISPELHQLLDHLGRRELERLRHLLDRRARLHRHGRLLAWRVARRRQRLEIGLHPLRPAPASATAARRLLRAAAAGGPAAPPGSRSPRACGGRLRHRRPRRRVPRGWDAGARARRRRRRRPAARRRRWARARRLRWARRRIPTRPRAPWRRRRARPGRRPPAVPPLKARAMSSSSTLEAAAFTLKPAFWRIARTSLLEIPFSFAIS